AVAEAAVDRVLGGPEVRDRLAALAAGVELGAHHRPQDPAAPVRGEDGDGGDAGGRNAPAGDRQLEGEGAGATDGAAVLPGGVHAFRGEDTRHTLDLVVGARPGASEVVPDRTHRRAQLVLRRAR